MKTETRWTVIIFAGAIPLFQLLCSFSANQIIFLRDTPDYSPWKNTPLLYPPLFLFGIITALLLCRIYRNNLEPNNKAFLLSILSGLAAGMVTLPTTLFTIGNGVGVVATHLVSTTLVSIFGGLIVKKIHSLEKQKE